MRVFIEPDTDRYRRKQRWSDELLIEAVEDIENGLNDGVLGSSVFKRRVAREGSGSATGYRVVVVLRTGYRAFIVEAFAKNVKKTHSPPEVRALRALADRLLAMSDESLALAVRANAIRELKRKDGANEDAEL